MNVETWKLPFEAYQGSRPFLFVSYSHKDHEGVFRILLELSKKGYRIWYDDGIDPGNEWAEEIARALKTCSCFLAFVSNNSLASSNVRDEMHFAREHEKTSLLVHMEPVDLPESVDLRFSRIQAIYKYRYVEEEAFYKKLLHSLDACEPPLRDVPGSVGEIPDENSLLTINASRQQLEKSFDLVEAAYRNREHDAVALLGGHLLDDFRIVAKQDSQDVLLAGKINNLSVYLTDSGNDVKAMSGYETAVRIYLERIGKDDSDPFSIDNLAMTYNNIGRLYRKLNPTSREAESYYRKSLELFRLLCSGVPADRERWDRLGMAHNNLGNSLSAQGKHDAAREEYGEALRIYEELSKSGPLDGRMEKHLAEARQNLP